MVQSNRRVVRQRRASRAPFLILISVILALSITLAVSFAFFISDDLTRPNVDKLSIVAQKMFSNAINVEPVKETAEMIQAFHKNDHNTENPGVKTEHIKAETLVAKTKAADPSYFDDAVFIGDSISVGLRVYGVLPTKNVIAEQNVNIMNLVNDTPVYRTSGTEKRTVFQAIAEQVPNPGKIYILIGANGIPGLSNEAHINYYGKFLDRLHQTYPNAMIYVESVTPITKNSKYIRDSFNTKKINDFNDRLYKLAQEKGVYYLNVQEVLRDDNGYLISDYDAGDGMHLKSNGHKAMYQYYLTHAVQSDGYIDKIV